MIAVKHILTISLIICVGCKANKILGGYIMQQKDTDIQMKDRLLQRKLDGESIPPRLM